MTARVKPGHAVRRDDLIMPTSTSYEILIRGRATERLLRPLLDDFTIDHGRDGVTRLIGVIDDPAHLHGILAHLTSVNAEVISVAPAPPPTSRTDGPAPACPSDLQPHTTEGVRS